MAKQIGITQNAYSKIELGYSEVTLRKLFIICQILQKPINEILISVINPPDDYPNHLH